MTANSEMCRRLDPPSKWLSEGARKLEWNAGCVAHFERKSSVKKWRKLLTIQAPIYNDSIVQRKSFYAQPHSVERFESPCLPNSVCFEGYHKEVSSKSSQFKFIDLFAGVGGFHAAGSGFGGDCVYAVEKDPAAARIYELNWGTGALGDITVDANEDQVLVPSHDLLFAGFPCQPFSKSGAQRGMDEARGTLFWNIARIIEVRRPSVVILENVRNLAGPR
ncbi:MAG: Modification methylase HhaI, partial [Actinomycetota bacterium]